VLIPAQQKAGKREEDCRRYVNGGCQELMLIGCEHSEGARWYFNLPRLLEVSLRPDILADYPAVFVAPVATESFEALYASVLANLRDVLTAISALGNGIGQAWPQVNPCPLISATLHDCLVTSRDLTAGGGRYNPTGLCYYGFATLADSLYAIQQAVFVQGLCTFDELRAALVADFAGYEKLLTALRKLPHYGQDYPEADAFAARLAHDIAALCAGLTNSRGGPIQPAIFSYWTYARAGRATGATPDGRHAGDYLSQGAAPSRLAKTPSTAHYLRSLSAIDWTDFPAIAVFDLQMPLVPPTPELEEQYVALLKTFVTLGGPTLQFTVTDPSTLRAAQEHPADYPNLVVRVAGYSAYFTALEKEVQDSIVTRTTVAMA